MILAVGLEGDGPRNCGGGPQSHDSNHSEASVLNFTVAPSRECFGRLALVKAEGVVQSGDHVLFRVAAE